MSGPTRPKQEVFEPKKRGADDNSELRYLAVGRIVRAHGIHGEVSMTVLTEFPERFETTEWFYLGNEFAAEPYHLKSYRWHRDNMLLTLDEVVDRTQAEQLRGLFVQVPIDEAIPLPDGSYYLYQLLGLQVVTTAGQSLGVIEDILETGANDVYVVKDGNKEMLLPDISEVVKSIDLEKNQMIVEIIAGLI